MFSKLKAISKKLRDGHVISKENSQLPELAPSEPPGYHEISHSHPAETGSRAFFDFPPEIRNMIYLELFRGCCARYKPDWNGDTEGEVSEPASFKLVHPPTANMLFTCRQVYEEALSVYWKTTTVDLIGLKPGEIVQFSKQTRWDWNGLMHNIKLEMGMVFWNLSTMRRVLALFDGDRGRRRVPRVIVEVSSKPKWKTFRLQEEYNMAQFLDMWDDMEYLQEFEYQTDVREELVTFKQMSEWAISIRQKKRMDAKLKFRAIGRGRFAMVLWRSD